MGSMAGLGDVWRKKTHLFLPEFENRTDSSIAGSYTDDAFLALTRRV